MIKLSNFIKAILILFLTPGLSGCPLLDFKIFIRNTSTHPAQIILSHEKVLVQDTIHLKSLNNIIEINNKTLAKLNQILMATSTGGITTLTIPPQHTLFLNDLIKSYDSLNNKILTIKTNNQEDTLILKYPYKNSKEIKRVRDRSYNYFYKTIIYYDIKQYN